MTNRKELIRNLIAEARNFRFCGPSDDPDQQTAVTTGYRYLVVQIQRQAASLLHPDLASRLNSIQIEFENLHSVFGARAELDALLPEIESVIDGDEETIVEHQKNGPFSRRYGYRTRPREIVVREDAPENLRHFVLDTAIGMGLTPSDLRGLVCSLLHRRPDPSNWSEYPNVWAEVQDLVYGCEWFKFYDFIERIYRAVGRGTGEAAMELPNQFQGELNEFFADEGIGWQMVDGEIITRGPEAFEAAVHTAKDVLNAKGRVVARDEIREALSDLSRRPEPDLTGAIQHAMSALECVARDVAGDEHATLGAIIKRYPGVIPKPRDDGVEKAWGYASENARHIREGQKPDRKEAELIVGLAAVVSTYLSR